VTNKYQKRYGKIRFES